MKDYQITLEIEEEELKKHLEYGQFAEKFVMYSHKCKHGECLAEKENTESEKTGSFTYRICENKEPYNQTKRYKIIH